MAIGNNRTPDKMPAVLCIKSTTARGNSSHLFMDKKIHFFFLAHCSSSLQIIGLLCTLKGQMSKILSRLLTRDQGFYLVLYCLFVPSQRRQYKFSHICQMGTENTYVLQVVHDSRTYWLESNYQVSRLVDITSYIVCTETML